MKNKVVLLLFFSLFGTLSCQEIDSIFHGEPDDFAAEEILQKKIVMLGDFAHSNFAAYNTVLSVLNKFFDRSINTHQDSIKLTLILETTGEQAKRINMYLESGILDTILDIMVPGGRLEDLEFYYNLRKLKEKTDKINDPNNSSLHFDVQGFEQVGYNFFNDTLLKLSKRQSEYWFVRQRDSILAERITGFLKNYENNKVLIYYGSGHLVGNYFSMEKQLTELHGKDAKGYFLAHYLKEYYGDTNVITIDQGPFDQRSFIDTSFMKLTNSNDDVWIDGNKNPWIIYGSHLVDYMLLRKAKLYLPTEIGVQLCKFVIDRSVNSLYRLRPLLPGYKATLSKNQIISSLMIKTGILFNEPEQIEDFFKEHTYESLAKNYSDSLPNRIYRFLHDTSGNRLRYMLYRLTGSNSFLNIDYIPDSLTWYGTVWPEIGERIEAANAITNFWIGYPDEKSNAKEYLIKKSGIISDIPTQYFKWFRKTYYNFE